jgi:outer membrane protein OmpA-like peptidoglycan-associated protein
MRFFILLILISTNSFGQGKKPDSTFCDCKKARVVEVAGIKNTPKTMAPSGPGEYMEISNLSHDAKYSFEKEHNSAWYKLIIKNTGSLVFDILPIKQEDDYDFMLYRSYSELFCDSLLDFRIKPVRACISRNKWDTTGRTGLNFDSKVEFVNKNSPSGYAKALTVKKGEVYYLVLDNVNENGAGHSIRFSVTVGTLLEGVIVDENKKPVVAEITLTDSKGEVIQTESSDKDGSYSIHAHLIKGANYSINFYEDKSLTYTKSFTLTDTAKLKALVTVLPKLKKGIKYSVGTINFVGNSDQTLPQALPAMKNLAKLMNKNPKLTIRIIGHLNGPSFKLEVWDLEFTKARATTVREFLIKSGIDGSRIEIDGKGDKEMLFPNAGPNEEEARQNRRVEIMVLDY